MRVIRSRFVGKEKIGLEASLLFMASGYLVLCKSVSKNQNDDFIALKTNLVIKQGY